MELAAVSAVDPRVGLQRSVYSTGVLAFTLLLTRRVECCCLEIDRNDRRCMGLEATAGSYLCGRAR